jgi:hypothetical protein
MVLQCRCWYMSSICCCVDVHTRFEIWNLVERIFCFSGWRVFMTLILPELSESLDCRCIAFFLPFVFVLIFKINMNIWVYAWICTSCIPGPHSSEKMGSEVIDRWESPLKVLAIEPNYLQDQKELFTAEPSPVPCRINIDIANIFICLFVCV